jgi:hypothetical protein
VESANRLWALLLHAWHVACPLRCTDPNGTLWLQYGVCVSRDEAPHPQLHQCRDCTPHPNTCVSCVTHCVMRRIRQAACEQRARPPAQDCILCEGRRLMIARLDSCQVKREADDDPRSRSSRNNVIQQHKPPPHRQKFFSFRAPCPPLWWGRARWLMIAQARSRHRVYMYITHHALFTSSARIAASSCVLSLCVDSIVSSCAYVGRVCRKWRKRSDLAAPLYIFTPNSSDCAKVGLSFKKEPRKLVCSLQDFFSLSSSL